MVETKEDQQLEDFEFQEHWCTIKCTEDEKH